MSPRLARRPARSAGFVWNVPNVITLARLASVPALWACLVMGERGIFTWLLLAALLSDIADGVIARVFDQRTVVGAALDSNADLLITLTALAGLFVFERPVLWDHRWGLGAIVALYVLATGAGAIRFGRLASFHTWLCRIAAYASGIWIMSLLFWGFQAWIFAVMLAVSAAAYLEELALVLVVPRWTPDVRGLYWVLRRRGA